MTFPKKAQGLPLNTIIIAILGVLVLIIVAGILYVQITKSGKEIKKISGAECTPPNTVAIIGDCDDVIYGSFTNVKVGQEVCCKPKAPATQ